MRKRVLVPLAIAWLTAGIVSLAAADSEDEFKSALAAAETANKEAGALKNQWTTTVQQLTAAKQAAAAGDFDKATSLARQAEALAKASIAQAKEQQEAWRAGEIR
jgi:multidrug resistance efflux pump